MRRFIRVDNDSGGLTTVNARHITSIYEYDGFTYIGLLNGDVVISTESEAQLSKRLEGLR